MSTPLVVGTDGSDDALRAVDWAADEAALRGCPLQVLHASLWEPYADSTMPATGKAQARREAAAGADVRRAAAPVCRADRAGAPRQGAVRHWRAAGHRADLEAGGPDYYRDTGSTPGSPRGSRQDRRPPCGGLRSREWSGRHGPRIRGGTGWARCC
ncbi:universal stress protein [Streptomyces sp. NPDC004296]|uniref:universal stress protein n=1 Tax=Streptomyces sp. NPDC004296 TaxID=3364697 RepID=UPI0036CA760A